MELNERVLQDGIISLDLVKEAQTLDNFIQEIVHSKVMPNNYFLRKGILLHRKATIERIVLPRGLICILVHSNHFSFHGRHSPIYKILELIKKVWYHPNLEHLITSNIHNCALCMHQKPNTSRLPKLGKSRIAPCPRLEWKLDLFHSLTQIGKYSSIL